MLDENRVLLDDGDEIPLVRLKGAVALPVLPPAAAVAAPVPKPVPVVDDLLTQTKSERREIKAIADATPAMTSFAATVATPATLDVAVGEAIAESGAALADDDMRRRFRMLVSLFFRDLRDKLETKSKFTMPVASGGMGMSDPDAQKAISIFENKVKAYRDAEAGRAAIGKADYVAERAEKHLADPAVQEKKEQDVLDQAHGRLLEKTGLAPAGSAASVSAAAAAPKMIPVINLSPPKPVQIVTPAPTPAASVQPSTFKFVEPPPNLPVAPIEPQMVTPAPLTTPAAKNEVPGAAPLAMSEGRKGAPTERLNERVMPRTEALSEGAPFRPVATLPAAPPPVSEKPSMTDIQTAPKLTGPVEELRQMRLEDFRRLSKDPREATLKIKDKIDLLEDLGFEKKTEGIRAWNDSAVNKLYLDILRRGLEGKPVPEVIAELEARKEPTLSKAEFDALMELNRKLRFG